MSITVETSYDLDLEFEFDLEFDSCCYCAWQKDVFMQLLIQAAMKSSNPRHRIIARFSNTFTYLFLLSVNVICANSLH